MRFLSKPSSDALYQLHFDLSATLQHELRHQQQQQKELLFCRSERDSAREEAAAATKDAMSLRTLLQVAQLRQTERETASKERLADSFEAERGRLEASLLEKVAWLSARVRFSTLIYSPYLRLQSAAV